MGTTHQGKVPPCWPAIYSPFLFFLFCFVLGKLFVEWKMIKFICSCPKKDAVQPIEFLKEVIHWITSGVPSIYQWLLSQWTRNGLLKTF